jgi:hypothetical protein
VSRTLTALQAIVLGLAVLLGVGLIATAILTIGGRKWFGGDALRIRAGFTNVQGVEVGTKVRVRGMDAGEVEGLEVPTTTDGQVFVRLRVSGKFRDLVRNDARVQIVSVGMLGGKAIEIDPGTAGAAPAEDGQVLRSKPTTELADIMDQVKTTLGQVVEGDGTVGKLARDPQLYNEMVLSLKALQDAAGSIQADAEAMKKLPFIGKLVEDPRGLLDRGTGEYNRKWFPETDLFETGQAVLTRQGRDKLDDLGPWLEGLMRHSGSELIVVGYGVPSADANAVRKLTQDQSRVVLEYLNEKFNRRFVFFKARGAHYLGMGMKPPMPRQDRKLPAPRVEVLVFVPQS